MLKPTQSSDFSAIRLKLASPDDIHGWSHGEVLKPETINYRTQKPEKDGLFCERIFGPSKDWECYCGKYKKIRYKGIVCDKCGVEVTRSLVRRERMGHIDLATSVSHIWFLRGVPSKIGLVLDLSVQSLEKVIYFANFIVTKVDEQLKQDILEQVRQEFKAKKKAIEGDFNNRSNQTRIRYQNQQDLPTGPAGGEAAARLEEEVSRLTVEKDERLRNLEEAMALAERELRELKPLKIISENVYQDLSLKFGHIFEAGMGAEAIRTILREVDLNQLIDELKKKSAEAGGAQKDKIVRRLKLLHSLRTNKIRPEWMVLTAIPVIPPDLRPMVPLDGGRFATSDLNDLYRRVINRNNRLKQLIELNAPEVICRNEKRMLQEAVDALIDNSARHGKTVMASTGQRRNLKSIADILKGKQGRFRQNLLGKRVDYSGRSVIIIGPKLKLNECGLPKKMAVELFKPFIISRLIKDELVYNVRSANRFIESGRIEVYDILEDIIRDATVLLNRAPTLHRLGIQGFNPVLIEGLAIQIHPLVCSAFNADFDGDQMAVHVPLTEEAKQEASQIMICTNNLLKPATGSPVVNPGQDIVLGCFYLTQLNESVSDDRVKCFSSPQEALIAYRLDKLGIQAKIKILMDKKDGKNLAGQLIISSVGRVIFNRLLPAKIDFINEAVGKDGLKKIVNKCLEILSHAETVKILDEIKEKGFKFLTRSGFSMGINDYPHLAAKDEIIRRAEAKVEEAEEQYEEGLLTTEERYDKVIRLWKAAKDEITESVKKVLDPLGSVASMITSGARGDVLQLTQMIGIKGLVTNPAGRIIELPVKGNFKEGFNVLEFFISTHGTRKGLSDTALRTANAGYLTRRLVDVAQEVVIREEDCKDEEGFVVTKEESEAIGSKLIDRIIGRVALQDIVAPRAKKPLVKKGEFIIEKQRVALVKLDLAAVKIRSIMSCQAKQGVCAKCYGYDLGYNQPVKLGTAVGIIAAQSIGEPGTQLTMKTFHMGGVAGLDITQGLPRVEEIFETRIPKDRALISEVAGTVKIEKQPVRLVGGEAGSEEGYQKVIVITYNAIEEDKYKAPSQAEILIKEGVRVAKGETLWRDNASGKSETAKREGLVKLDKHRLTVIVDGPKTKELPASLGNILVKDGDEVEVGDQLTAGGVDLHQLYRLKGRLAAQKYLIKEIQQIYSSQGQKLNDKHIEIIARQLFSKVYITDGGDTYLLPGEVVDSTELAEANLAIKKEKGLLAKGNELLLGITKVSLANKSWLAAASFQETSRVLINAAITGKVDRLEGLKENVVIGHLIPAGTGFKK
ncbi:MAG: DNA-directed RNA polymerase subunit beta' [bacterium]